MKYLGSLLCFSLLNLFVVAQNSAFTNAAKNAFLIYRLAEKKHIQPRLLDEQFSKDLFDLVLKKIDVNKRIFLQSEINDLEKYRSQLHIQIANRKFDFIQQLTAIYLQHLQQLDTITENICKQPFNLEVNEKYTVAEDTNYPLNPIQQKTKWAKQFKLTTLYTLAAMQDTIKKIPIAQQKKFTDSIETVVRKKINSTLKRALKVKMQSPGGIEQLVGNIYCKAIALCYDPHSAYMSLSDKENFESSLGRIVPSFGFSLSEDDKGNVVIDDLTRGSGAFKSGLINKGDKIVSIQWEKEKPIDVSDADIDEVIRILNISNHATATITFVKPDGTKRQISLLKEVQEDKNEEDEDVVKSFVMKGEKTVGYISLPSFYIDWENNNQQYGCANDVAKEIVKLKKEKIEGLIIDVRYNGGGSVGEAVDLCGIFIDAGPVSLFKKRDPKPITLKDGNRGTIYDGPMVIMVNGYSASASELFAAAMQDYHRAVIVGSTTYGKATGQSILPLDTTIETESDFKNSKVENFLKLSLSQVYRITGKTAQFNGDPTMSIACKSALMKYKQIAEKETPKKTDFFLKSENFEKMKKEFEKKKDRTQADVDAYNKAVKEFNSAVNISNQAGQNSNNLRNQLNEEWEKAEKDFFDRQIPYFKK